MYVQTFYMDSDFGKLIRIIPAISTLNTIAAAEQVQKIE